MKTRAAVLHGPTKTFSVEELELDEPKAGEVLVKMVATGICHSDWHFATGDHPARYPIVPGHEGAGIVEKVGPGVTEVQPGDHVLLTFIPPCGKCRWCLTGLPVLCDRGAGATIGAQLDGTFRLRTKDGQEVGQFAMIGCFSEYTVAPADAIVKIDPDIPLDRACLVSCCVPTGVGAAAKRGEVRAGEVVAVFGLGGVGMNAVQGAALAGASKVIAVDIVPWKLEAAQEFGATHTINAQYEDPVQRILDLTNGVGADKTIVTIGHVEPEHIGIAYRATRKAGRCVVVGLAPIATDSMKVPPADLVLLGKEVVGTLYGHVNPRVDFPYLLQLYRAGRLKLDELVTKTYRLDEINQGYADLLEGRVIRGVILFD
ncbi:NDMA-dependent alcohol dehydrogenase [bacterium HR28]|jgi:S-(hydroxymethyl)glutathione dehydrogenase/alcohol dehydrogenase|nr:NDMA-dependent alcohol dehydrogenase [bacterium HR28]